MSRMNVVATVSDKYNNQIKQYLLEVEPADVLATYEEARQVWFEYHVKFEGVELSFELKTYKTYQDAIMYDL